jgi:hypothetical protein
MKLPFRFHRGELNGFFLLRLATFLNFAISDIIDELVYWAKCQFKLESEISSDFELPMRSDDIIGIGKIAGIFPLFFASGAWPGMVFFTESYIVSGKNRSERGLYNWSGEHFVFVRTVNDDYPDDIATEASAENRMTLVPTGTVVLGYVRSDEELYDYNGNIIWANVHATKPVDVAWDPFYGEAFSTMSSDANVIAKITLELTKLTIEAMQSIRYNGATIAAALELTQVLCADYIYDISIVYSANHYLMTYRLNTAVSINNRISRYTMWQYIMKLKFKLFEITEII